MAGCATYTEVSKHLCEVTAMSTTNEHNIIWVNHPESKKGFPEFCEEVFTGAFSDALEHISNLAKGARFMVGQVLSKDGKILANVAPQGNIRLSSE